MAEYIEYHPLKFWLDPASIAEIVAHIQTYLVNNPINSTTEIETIIHDYLIAHPELIGGVDSVNGQTGEVVLTADNISAGENVTIKNVLDSLQDQIDDIVASIPSDYQQLINDVSDLKSALTTVTTKDNTPKYYDNVTDGITTGYYINKTNGQPVANESFMYAVLNKSIYGYSISGRYIKNAVVTPVVYINEDGAVVGTDDLPNGSGILYTDWYDITFPETATTALVTMSAVTGITNLYQYNNGSKELRVLSGTLINPVAYAEYIKNSSATIYTDIYLPANRRYYIISTGQLVTRIGFFNISTQRWDFYNNLRYVNGTSSADGRVVLETSGADSGNIYVFDTTDNDSLNDFINTYKENALNIPYDGLLYNELISKIPIWYSPKLVGSGSFVGETASVYYSRIYSVGGHRYVFIVDGSEISDIGLVGSSGWVERVNANIGEFNATGSYRFGIAYGTNGQGNFYVFDTTGDDELNEYLLLAGTDFAMTMRQTITKAYRGYVDDQRSEYFEQQVVAYGDSVTARGAWYQGVVSYFGAKPLNRGVGGATVSSVGSNGFCTDARVNTIPTTTKLLLIMGGINDWAQNVAIGERSLTNVDTTTIYGAVNVLIDKLHARIPDAKIVCMGCTFAMRGTETGYASRVGVLNNLGLTTLDYGKALADAFSMNGVDSFNIGEHCGWNTTNIPTFVNWDGAYFHPNQIGGARMADVIVHNVR